MKNNFFLLYVGLFILVGCVENQIGRMQVVKIDSIPRVLPGAAMHVKSAVSNLIDLKGYYSAEFKTLLLTGKEFKKNIPLRKYDPLVTFSIVNKDTIILLFKDSLAIIDGYGLLKKMYYFNSYFEYNKRFYNIGIATLPFPDMFYNAKSKLIIIPILRYDKNWWDPDFFRSSKLFVGLNLNSSKIDILDLEYPSIYSKYNFAEQFAYYATLNDKNELIVSFNMNADLIKYDIVNRISSNISIANKNDQISYFDTSYKNDMNVILKYNKSLTIYNKILFNQRLKLYYRTLLKPTSKKSQLEHGSYYSNFDVIVRVYDSAFNLLQENNLGDSVNSLGAVVNSDGIQLKKFTPNDKWEYFITLN